ncbi:MAG: dihydrodipicolinate synthase family protein [Gammaproteobacteria bacterium]|nr:dihydrodipicolinate synthase family protein [Gammaproteobacteria bacterium]
MLKIKKISGPVFAVLTPFDAEGKINFPALSDYLGFLQDKGVETIIANGTTAEFPSLSLAEKRELLECCRKEFAGVILNNISSCCLSDCIQLAAHSQDHADALVILPPYYYANSSQEGLLAFFKAVLRQSRQPVYFYNFPKHTQNLITPAMAEILLNEHENLAGIKDSQANLEISAEFKLLKARDFQVFIGSDRLALEALKKGFDGSVTSGGNPFPELLVSIRRHFHLGDLDNAAKAQDALNVWSKFRKQNPLGEIAVTKAAMRTRLKNFPIFVRPPLQSAGADVSEAVAKLALRSRW